MGFRLLTTVAAVPLVILGLGVGAGGKMTGMPFVSAALAQESGSHGSGGEGGKGQGSQGGHEGSEGSGHDSQGSAGKGQGGPSSDSEGQGPRAGYAGGSGGGKPAWAQEGIPEVELGRLSVARSPSHVLDRAYEEALATITADMVSFYSLSLDDMIEKLSLDWDNVSLIDSPLQNLALLQDALDGTSTLVTDKGVTNSTDTLLAVFLGIASDKTVPITTDTVVAVTTILGTPITGTDATSLATEAESVRIAVLAGHG